MKQIAINGFGRIGKTFLRTVFSDLNVLNKLNIAAINIGPSCLEYLDIEFKYDSVMGTIPLEVSYKDKVLSIGNKKIKILSECNPEEIEEWKSLGIDWVVEATGCFTKKEDAALHLKAGAKKVLITAPGENEDITIIPGINENDYDPKNHKIIAMGSCTTNCLAMIIKVLKESFIIKEGLMTTIHAYTNDQVLLDISHHEPRRARGAALNIIPTKTGANKVITKIYPELEGKIYAQAIRVPVPIVSIVDFSFTTEEKLSSEKINRAFEIASKSNLKNFLEYSTKPLVSSDFKGNGASCIFDSLLTLSTSNMGKVFGWYDNEWGYSLRLRDFLLHNS